MSPPLPDWVPLALGVAMAVEEVTSLGPRRPEATQADRGSKHLIVWLTAAGFGLAFFSWRRLAGVVPFPHLLTWAGIAVTLLGIALRQWAIFTLGRFFTRTVQVSGDQPVVDRGPYRLLRHPSYSGALLGALGVGFALGNLPCLLLVVLPMAVGLGVRIRVEERALLSAIGEPYRAYMKRSWRLVPFVL